jgi:exopolysaccharide biosynthesis protein/predicted phosphodiesterase
MAVRRSSGSHRPGAPAPGGGPNFRRMQPCLPGRRASTTGRKSRFGPLALTIALLAAGVTAPVAVAADPQATAEAVTMARPSAPGVAEDSGRRPPLGRRVAAQPDDGALTTLSAPATPADRLQTARTVQTIAPGVKLTSDRTYDAAGFVDSLLLTTDLAGPTKPRLLSAAVSDPTRPTELADTARAVAAVNGDFFALGTTNAPIGAMVQDGALLKADATPQTVVGLDAAGAGRIADLLLEGEVTVAGQARPLAGLNSNGLPADSVGLYTPAWGKGDRQFVRVTGAAVEIEVQHGLVTAVRPGAGAVPVPVDGLVLIATGSSATSLASTPVGTPVTAGYHARSDAPGPFSQALGAHLVLIRGGQRQPINAGDATNTALKPRTAIGWTADRHLLLYVADGGSSRSRGLTSAELADRLAELGATDAVMLDGGGSSQLVARKPGDASVSVSNVPSDGGQRAVPDAVGLVPPAGSGRLHGLDIRTRSARVFPGLSRSVAVAGFDETYAPAPSGAVRFRAEPGDLAKPDADGVLRGGHPGTGVLVARSGRVDAQVPLRVLGPLARLESDAPALSFAPGDYRDVTVSGRDAEGFSAPVEPRDLQLTYDHAVARVDPQPDGSLRVTGLPDANGKGTLLTVAAGGQQVTIPVTVGLANLPVSSLAGAGQWRGLAAKATAAVSSVDTSDRPGAAPGELGLRLSYDFRNQPVGTSAAYAVAAAPLALPPGSQRLAMWVKGDGQSHWLRAMMAAQGSTNVPFTFAQKVDWTGWRRIEGLVPTGFTAPITLSRIYLVETDPTRRNAGQLDFALLDARVGVALDVPDVPDQPDPAVAGQGGRTAGPRAWRFAIVSDTHINADGGTSSYAYTQTARALDEIAAAKPDFVLLSGDGVDNNRPQDFALFRRLLDEHLPASIPLRWAVGNHESGAVAGGTLDQFVASTSLPTRQTFDAKGTRFILLNSTLASLRRSDFSQLTWLQQQLGTAATDRTISNVVVALHHPVLDPTGTGASELSDPYEGALLEQWLSAFRVRSGKQVALVSGHAHTAHVRRNDGVLQFNAPVVGKVPYGDAGHGGFSAWSMVTLDPNQARVDPLRLDQGGLGWFQADVKPLLSRIELTAPEVMAAQTSTTVGAVAIDEGQGGRIVPLRYPASVSWSGAGLAVVSDDRQLAAARRDHDYLAVLDLRTLRLVALRPGDVELVVRTGSLTATRLIQVT